MMTLKFKRSFKKITSIFSRFHIVLFVVLVFGGLSVAVFMLSSTLQSSTEPSLEAGAAGIDTSFDTETIERISELRTGEDGASNIQLPSGRINPFAE